MREFIYISAGKIAGFDPGSSLVRGLKDRGFQFNLAQVGGIGIGPATQPPTLVEQLVTIEDALVNSQFSPTWFDSVTAVAGSWVMFEGPMRFGRVHRDSGTQNGANLVCFYGSGAAEEWPSLTSLLLTGWAGHMMDADSSERKSLRMGSRTEHFYDALSDYLDQGGVTENVDLSEFNNHGRYNASVHLKTGQGIRFAENMLRLHLPGPAVWVKGLARVLTTLDSDGYAAPLAVASPLFVEYAPKPLPIMEMPQLKSRRF